MTLNSAIEAEMPFLRSEENARQVDTCRITRPGVGQGDFNESTGQYDSPDPVVVYEGRCRIPKRSNLVTSTANAGEAAWQVGEYPLNLPIDGEGAADVRVGQTVTYLTATDPALVGNVYGITEVADQSQATARRFRMKRTVSS